MRHRSSGPWSKPARTSLSRPGSFQGGAGSTFSFVEARGLLYAGNRHVLDHRWLHLFRLEDDEGVWRFCPGGGWQPVAP